MGWAHHGLTAKQCGQSPRQAYEFYEGVGEGSAQPAWSSPQQKPRRQMVRAKLLCECPDLLLHLTILEHE